MGEAVADVAKFTFFDVLFDRIERIFLRDLEQKESASMSSV